MTRMRVRKYSSAVWFACDALCYLLTYPCLLATSSLFSCYLTSSQERGRHLLKGLHYLLLGPAFASLSVLLLPPYLAGQALWVALCHCPLVGKTDFATVDFDGVAPEAGQKEFTFVTSNLLLGLDFLGKFQNMGFVYGRLWAVMDVMKSWSSSHLHNLKALDDEGVCSENKKDLSVQTELPNADFLLIQEVWDRFFASALMFRLRPRFRHFVADVSKQSWGFNFCTGSSGLFLASRYPILDVEYFPFDNRKRNWQAFISYGMIMAKVDLGTEGDGKRRVGYFANLHCMAYQEKQDQIGVALNNAMVAYDAFRRRSSPFSSSSNDETVAFAVLGGDFNCDNLSPADRHLFDHPIFSKYTDACMEGPGRDKEWAVGTELRQMKVHDPEVSTPEKFRRALCDDVLRRFYVIDADVEEQTLDLMYCDPKPDPSGRIAAQPWGGKRRIDKIVYDKECSSSRAVGAAFLSCYAGGLTDHIPFALTIATD